MVLQAEFPSRKATANGLEPKAFGKVPLAQPPAGRARTHSTGAYQSQTLSAGYRLMFDVVWAWDTYPAQWILGTASFLVRGREREAG